MLYPPLKSLPIFVAAAESESFATSAEKNFITLPAVSQQIKLLEQDLNCKLFSRSNNGVKLTPDGKIFLEKIKPALEQIYLAKQSLITEKHSHITISLLNTLATYFLIPRIGDFYLKYPHIDVRISTNWSIPDSQQNGIDMIIGYGKESDWPNCKIDLLSTDELIAVSHPDIESQDNLERLINSNRLLSVPDVKFREADWPRWCKANNLTMPTCEHFTPFANSAHAIQACLNKAGILVTHHIFVKDLIKSNQLKSIGKAIPNKEANYYLIYTNQSEQDNLKIIANWLKQVIN